MIARCPATLGSTLTVVSVAAWRSSICLGMFIYPCQLIQDPQRIRILPSIVSRVTSVLVNLIARRLCIIPAFRHACQLICARQSRRMLLTQIFLCCAEIHGPIIVSIRPLEYGSEQVL